MADYLHEAAELDQRIFPTADLIAAQLGGTTRVEVIEVPHDNPDWTLGSFWAPP